MSRQVRTGARASFEVRMPWHGTRRLTVQKQGFHLSIPFRIGRIQDNEEDSLARPSASNAG